MSLLGDSIDAAVASVIAGHPKLFADAKSRERAQKLFGRESLKQVIGETPSDMATVLASIRQKNCPLHRLLSPTLVIQMLSFPSSQAGSGSLRLA